ncbi:cell division protein FtsL [Halopseudomonas laoshanensis]|uniref:Cell division protein FtsL n=1 Tax=Halopseudomonas laoshanensis TaxID=2268758 RepID=A0A7V7GUM5_9GAMM|nr:cell division protein FtsL [Halopseudomonas laoshanensis]KAA0694974.1 cell division protein FtsL [Halopseudomonas laoshanensis]
MSSQLPLLVERHRLPRSSGWLAIVWVLVVVSALAVAYSAHWSRVMLNDLAAEMSQREKAQAEWGRLILEQSTWTAHNRVETLAASQLNMRVPEAVEVILVKP